MRTQLMAPRVMQALRHFYVLAANPRIVRAVDVHVRQPVYVPVSLTATAESHVSGGITLAPHEAPDGENVPANTQFFQPQAAHGAHAHAASAPAGLADSPNGAAAQLGGKAAGDAWSGMVQQQSPLTAQRRTHSAVPEGLPSAGATPPLHAPGAAGHGPVSRRLCPCIMPEPSALQAVEVLAAFAL